jgi:prevent-host-death family protein
MSTHSIAEAKNNLSQLVDLAVNGESVVITRHGKPMVELKPVEQKPGAVTQAELDWIAQRRVPRLSATEDAVSLVRRMRDEGP